MVYFKFENIYSKNEKKSNSSLGNRFLVYVIKCVFWFIPKTNPDFEDVYENVITWYIEYDDINNYANREVGIDANGKVVVKGPYLKNLGFWTSEDLTYKQFISEFEIVHIEKKVFDVLWNKELE